MSMLIGDRDMILRFSYWHGELASLFSPIMGTGAGSGMALLYVMTAIGLSLGRLGRDTSAQLHSVEERSPTQSRVS